jgi:Tfp pilus assembly protein PilV
MTEALIAVVVVAVIVFLVVTRKTTRWNADPRQQQMARMMIEAVKTKNTKLEFEILSFALAQGWPKREMLSRVAHAVSITKVSSVPATYETTKKLGLQLDKALRATL